MAPALRIERVEVFPHLVEALVHVADDDSMRTSAFPGLARRAAKLLPGLERHTCENDTGRRLVDELSDTETPHLLEHVACELMALAGSPRSLKGETSWDFGSDGRGRFRVRLGYDHDLVALGALSEGAGLVEWLLVPEGPAPDVAAAAARLRSVRVAGAGA